MKKTPLYDQHVARNAKMVDFAGFMMPLSYTSIEDEHAAVRNHAGYFDVSHMGEIFVDGPGSTTFIEMVFTNTLPDVHQARYGFILQDNGIAVDDVLVYRLAEESYWIVCNASNIEAVMTHLDQIPFGGTLTNLSDTVAMIALQGPASQEILETILNEELELKRFRFKELYHIGEKLLISRTGYTGEDGYEIYGDADAIMGLWTTLSGFEKAWPCGLGARDTLRFEAGYPLFGHEIIPILTPQSSNLSMFIDYRKKTTYGIKALIEEQEKGLVQILAGVELLDKGILREGYGLYSGDERIGEVTTGYKLKHFDNAKALAFVQVQYAELGTMLEAEIRGKRLPAQIIAYPFYQKLKKKKVS